MLNNIESFIKSLLENPSISVNKETTKINRELLKVRDSGENFKEVFEIVNIEVPKEDWKYLDLGSIMLDWDSTNERDEEYLWGGFKIHTYSSALSTPSHFWDNYNNDSRFWKNNPQPEAEAIWKEFLPKLNYFQKSGHGDDGTYGCILREEGVYPCPIYFFDSGIWFKMDMSLEEYYNTMIACKAVYYW